MTSLRCQVEREALQASGAARLKASPSFDWVRSFRPARCRHIRGGLMLRGVVGIAIIAAVCPLAAQAPARDTAPPVGTAVIRGRVIAAGEDRPLPKVEVRGLSSALKIDNATLTDANGR